MNPDQNSPSTNYPQQFSRADNLANMDKIQRMWRAQWPEFSWLTIPGDDSSRCYQMFAPDISRVGYGPADSNGWSPVWSIMCPQQGIWIPTLGGTLNIEVTVTSSGGVVNEKERFINAQMTIQPKIWFSPDTVNNNSFIQRLKRFFDEHDIPFPSSKATAIKLDAYGVDATDNPLKTNVLTIKSGLDPNYSIPSFAQHSSFDTYGQIAWSSAYVAVEVGEPISVGSSFRDEIADEFNKLIMYLFNVASGNLLQNGNVLSWNVWVIAPEKVYREEWLNHADYWRFSLDVNHRSPEGRGRDPQYFDGTPFSPETNLITDILSKIEKLLGSKFTLSPELQNHFDSFSSRQGEDKVTFL